MHTLNEIDVISKCDMDISKTLKYNDMKDVSICIDNRNNKAYINVINERLIGKINETHPHHMNSKMSYKIAKNNELID